MIQKIGIIGAGTMGRGIAQICASSGLSVTLCDVGQEQLDDAAKSIETGYTRMVQRERMSQQDCDAALSKLSFDTSLDALAGSDLTIEAATETPEVKLPLFEKIADICGEKAILASNTSSISLTRIAAAVPRPERVIGMHFSIRSRLCNYWRSFARYKRTIQPTTPPAASLNISIKLASPSVIALVS